MSYYEYNDYNDLLNDVSNGEYIINQPMMYNGEKMSFLNKLLDFSNIDNENLHNVLYDIINRIKISLLKENKKEPVRKLLNHIKGEWNNEKKLYCENDCGCMNNVGDFTKQTSETEDFVKNIEHKMSEKNVFSKLLKEKEMGEYSNIELLNLGEDALKKCDMLLNSFNKDLIEINNEKQKIESIDLDFILDLSLKHVELYECFNDEDKKEIINENLHNIFLNYAMMISLLKKQYSHTENIIQKLKSRINESCNFIKKFMKQFNNSGADINQTFEFF